MLRTGQKVKVIDFFDRAKGSHWMLGVDCPLCREHGRRVGTGVIKGDAAAVLVQFGKSEALVHIAELRRPVQEM